MTNDELKALAELFRNCGTRPPYPTPDEAEAFARGYLAKLDQFTALTQERDRLAQLLEAAPTASEHYAIGYRDGVTAND